MHVQMSNLFCIGTYLFIQNTSGDVSVALEPCATPTLFIAMCHTLKRKAEHRNYQSIHVNSAYNQCKFILD